MTLTVVLAGLAGGIVWNLLTWLLGIPSSSSHSLIGGVVGATIAAVGLDGVKWQRLVSKVIIPAGLSPIIAGLGATTGSHLVYRISRGVSDKGRQHGFRLGQIGSAAMVSLAHGTNDAQKAMGIITLALIANGNAAAGAEAPFWVIVCCALAIAVGTFVGGWRVIRTMGKGLVEIDQLHRHREVEGTQSQAHPRTPERLHVCHHCARVLDPTAPRNTDDDIEIDHLQPVARRPDLEYEPDNCVLACHGCNRSKSDRPNVPAPGAPLPRRVRPQRHPLPAPAFTVRECRVHRHEVLATCPYSAAFV